MTQTNSPQEAHQYEDKELLEQRLKRAARKANWEQARLMYADEIEAECARRERAARIDELERVFIGASVPKPEIWSRLDGVGHPSQTLDDRLAELRQSDEGDEQKSQQRAAKMGFVVNKEKW